LYKIKALFIKAKKHAFLKVFLKIKSVSRVSIDTRARLIGLEAGLFVTINGNNKLQIEKNFQVVYNCL